MNTTVGRLTTSEAATYLRISPWTLRRLANEGEVRGAKYAGKWTFEVEDLEDYRDGHANRGRVKARRRRARRTA